MAIREILTVPHDTLKRKARKVTDFGPGLQTLIDDMLETMRDAPGSGLAAPQIGELQRVFIAEFGDEEIPPKLYIIVNPEIKRKSKETVSGIEGCLSVPEYVGEVERATAVTIKGQNRHGQKMKLKANGWLARIFQHEIDHLDGVVFLDLAEKIYSLEDIQAEEMEGVDLTGIGEGGSLEV
jgi:peptide deformylase